MNHKVRLPLYLSWRALKDLLGWPYGRSHTGRLMDPKYTSDPFPQCGKIGPYRNGRPMWYTPHVLEFFKRHGLAVPENVEFS
jgi:hypothetical protein